MRGKSLSTIILILLFFSILTLAFNVQSVYAVPPVADFDWNPPFPNYSDTVMVISTSTPNGGEIVKYNWTLTSLGGKGSWTSPNNLSTRTFHADWPGDISVTLNITDSEGEWDTETKIIHMLLINSPIADFSYTPEFPSLWDSAEFTFTGIPGNTMIVGYNWTLVDLGGSASWTSPNNLSTRTFHADWPGDISVTLNVTALTGFPLREVWDAKTKNITILPPPPVSTVGGIHIPVNKVSLSAQYVALTILLAVVAVTVIYVKKRKKNWINMEFKP